MSLGNLSPSEASLEALLGVTRRGAGKEGVWKGWESPETGVHMHFTSPETEGSGAECCHRMVAGVQRSVRSDQQLQVRHYAYKFHCGHFWVDGLQKRGPEQQGGQWGLFW